MKYVRSGDKIIVSLERVEELCGTLKMLAAEENIKFALVRAHGSCLRVTLGSYDKKAEAAKKGIEADILLEINVAREESKFGFFLEDAESAIRTISQLPHIHIRGLMTIAPFVDNPEENRGIFQKLYQFCYGIELKKYEQNEKE